MFPFYLSLAVRHLVKHRVYTALNGFGLGLTIACCLIIFLFVHFQTSFDRFHPNADRIGRVVTDLHLGNVQYSNGVPYPMAAALREEFPFVRAAATVDGFHDVLVSVPGPEGKPPALFKETNAVAYAEPDIFSILNFPLLRGNLTAFEAPNTALITEKAAEKYFGTSDAIGRDFQAFSDKTFRVVGILRDMPDNTDCGREVFCSWASLQSEAEQKEITSWGSLRGNTRCYVLLERGHSIAELAASLPAFSAKYPHPVMKEVFRYQAYSLPALHFDARYDGAFDRRQLWVLSFIGLFLLLTACVNFINMATAQSLARTREVGIRKALGSTKAQLFGQFLVETGVLVLFAFLIGLLLIWLSLPYLNTWTGQHLLFSGLFRPESMLFSLLLGGMLVLLAGSYPALLLARFQPVASLKGQVSTRQAGGLILRRGLVTLQFAISQLLIIAALVVTLQMRYALDSDWGFQREALVSIPVPEIAKTAVLKQQLSPIPGIQNLSFCSAPPASGSSNQTFFNYGNRSEPEKWAVTFLWGDENYLGTFGLQLVAGRNFDEADPQPQCLVNETFVKNLNLGSPDDVAGTPIRIAEKSILITGVVRNFHTNSFREKIPPLLIQRDSQSYGLCALSLGKRNPESTLKNIASVWSELFPGHYYEYHFLDETIAGFYQSEIRAQGLINLFTGIAILVGCIGLFGLAAFMIARKTKEIGIRKILGASASRILWLFGMEYLKLAGIAFLIAAPLGWWAMQEWLSGFAYRIGLHWWIFIVAGVMVAVIAMLTVAVQSVKAALVNPVESLRRE